jgi:hypothetical protein
MSVLPASSFFTAPAVFFMRPIVLSTEILRLRITTPPAG